MVLRPAEGGGKRAETHTKTSERKDGSGRDRFGMEVPKPFENISVF
jgi:hypothetical protein